MSDELANLAADLRAAGEKAQNMAADAIAKTAADISNDAKVFAPVRTGNLRASIGYDVTEASGGVSAEIGPTVEYANFWKGARQSWPRGHSSGQHLIDAPPISNRLCGK